MDKTLDVDKAAKLAIILGALLAGFGVFYHYVIFLPASAREKSAAAEREKQEEKHEAEREKQEAETQETQRRIAYETCLRTARELYEADWATACKTKAEASEAGLKNCLASGLSLGECKRIWGGNTDSSPSCTLPKVRADSINAGYEKEKDRCATEARLGLR